VNTRRRGYTLLELLVVLVILSLAGVVAVPAFAAWRPVEARRAAAGELVRVLDLARQRAVSGGVETELVIDPARARAWLHPRDTSFTLALPDSCRLRGTARSRVKLELGGAANGALPLVVCGTDSARVRIDALTGAPHVELLP
jgi:general secretion pathway protein H